MTDITMVADSLKVVKDPAEFDGDNFKAGTEKTVVGKNEKINLGLEITGAGLVALQQVLFLKGPIPPGLPIRQRSNTGHWKVRSRETFHHRGY